MVGRNGLYSIILRHVLQAELASLGWTEGDRTIAS